MGYSMDIDLFQRIAPFPEFSVLEMYLESIGHVFGAMMLDLLGTCSSILRLKLIMQSSWVILQSVNLIYNLFKRPVLYILQTCFLGIHNQQ
jgi:hypothetical protein